jgi:hypothetical protein
MMLKLKKAFLYTAVVLTAVTCLAFAKLVADSSEKIEKLSYKKGCPPDSELDRDKSAAEKKEIQQFERLAFAELPSQVIVQGVRTPEGAEAWLPDPSAYEIVVSADGNVDYLNGFLRWTISKEEILKLVDLINATNYMSISQTEVSCSDRRMDPDGTMTVSSVTVNGSKHEIWHYGSRMGGLSEFENGVKKILEVKKHQQEIQPVADSKLLPKQRRFWDP